MAIFQKRTEDMSCAEIELMEVFDLIKEAKDQLRTIKTLTEDIYFKAQISHSLIVVRKIGEEKIEALNQVLD